MMFPEDCEATWPDDVGKHPDTGEHICFLQSKHEYLLHQMAHDCLCGALRPV